MSTEQTSRRFLFAGMLGITSVGCGEGDKMSPLPELRATIPLVLQRERTERVARFRPAESDHRP